MGVHVYKGRTGEKARIAKYCKYLSTYDPERSWGIQLQLLVGSSAQNLKERVLLQSVGRHHAILSESRWDPNGSSHDAVMLPVVMLVSVAPSEPVIS